MGKANGCKVHKLDTKKKKEGIDSHLEQSESFPDPNITSKLDLLCFIVNFLEQALQQYKPDKATSINQRFVQ